MFNNMKESRDKQEYRQILEQFNQDVYGYSNDQAFRNMATVFNMQHQDLQQSDYHMMLDYAQNQFSGSESNPQFVDQQAYNFQMYQQQQRQLQFLLQQQHQTGGDPELMTQFMSLPSQMPINQANFHFQGATPSGSNSPPQQHQLTAQQQMWLQQHQQSQHFEQPHH